MISWSSSVGEPWVAGSILASTPARVPAESREDSSRVTAGVVCPRAVFQGLSYSARLTAGGATREGAPVCVDGAEDAQHTAKMPPTALLRAGQRSVMGSTGFDVDLRAHLTAPAGAHTAETTVGKHQLPTTTATPLSPSRRKRVDVRGARVARRRHHTSWTGALRRRPVETQTVVEASTPRRQGPLRALRAATRVSEGV